MTGRELPACADARKAARYRTERDKHFGRSIGILSEIEQNHTWRGAFVGGVRADARILAYVSSVFGVRVVVDGDRRHDPRHLSWPPEVGITNRAGAGRAVPIRRFIETLAREAMHGYSHGRAWFWSVVLDVVQQNAEAPFRRCIIDGPTANWKFELSKRLSSDEVVPNAADFSKAIRSVEARTGMLLSGALAEIDTLFHRIYHPSAKLFHLASWYFALGGPFGGGISDVLELGQDGSMKLKETRSRLLNLWNGTVNDLRHVSEQKRVGIKDHGDLQEGATVDSEAQRRRALGEKGGFAAWSLSVAPWALMPHPGIFGHKLSADLHGPFYPFAYEGNLEHARCLVAPLQFVPLHVAQDVMRSVALAVDHNELPDIRP